MAGDDYIVNNINDPLNRYTAVIGVPSRRRIFFGAACIFFVLALVAITFAIIGKQDNPKNIKLPYALFQNALDVSVDPCVDFYNFTCGLWAENNPVNELDDHVTTFSLLQDRSDERMRSFFESVEPSKDFPRLVNDAINFYNKCVQQNNTNRSDIDLLLKYFDYFGGWPILNKSKWNESLFDLFHSSAFLIKYLDIHSIIGVYSTDSDKNGGKNVVYLRVPTILQDEDSNLNDVAFSQMIYAIIQSLNNSYVNPDLIYDIDNLKSTGNKWIELLTLSPKRSDPTFISIGELSVLIPEFDWLKYLQLITNDTLLKINETLTIHDIVSVSSIDYLKRVVNVMKSDVFSKEELANLFGWFVAKKIWLLLPGVLQNYSKLNRYNSEDAERAAKLKCYELVLELYPCFSDYLYVKNLSHAGIQDNKVLMSFLKLTFEEIIQKSNWLDEISRRLILQRLSDMKTIIGFPSYLNNKEEFDELYKDFPEMRKFSLSFYFEIVQCNIKKRILEFKIATNLSKIVLPRPVSHVRAYYIYHKNSLVYPLSLHNPPFYYFEGPWYLNFGAIGSVIGHEMMHGIDCTGVQGNDLNVTWFSEGSRALYKTRAACFKDQYSIYDNTGMYKNNGTVTLRENVADSEGLHLAFEAYKKHENYFGLDKKYEVLKNYSPEQMFFIAFGTIWCSQTEPSYKAKISQSHSLPDVRVNNAVSNSEHFAVAFNCPKGSPMNPLKKCYIW